MPPTRYSFQNEQVDVENAGTPQETATVVPRRYTAPEVPTPTTDTSADYTLKTPEQIAAERTAGVPTIDQAREDARKSMQATIDAINANYANLISAQQQKNEGYLGQTRAVNARSGILGQDFGNANMAGQEKANAQSIKAIQDEQNLKIAEVNRYIDQSAKEEIAAKKQAALDNSAAYSDYLAKEQVKAKDLFSTLAGINATLSPQQKAYFTKTLGYDDATTTLLFNATKEKANQTDYQYDKDAKAFIGVNPVTKKLDMIKVPQASPEADIVLEILRKYPDAGITLADDLATASAKIQQSKIYKDQVRGPVGSGGGGGGSTGNPAVDAWVNQIQNGTAKITNVPAALKNAVITALDKTGNGGNSRANELAQQALDAITTLEGTAGKSGAVGAKGFSSLFGLKGKPIGGTDAAGYVAQLDRVKALLTLPNLQYLKGLGAMSDREFNTIQASVAALNRDMSEKQYDEELGRIKEVLTSTVQKAQSLNSNTETIIAPDGQEIIITD